MMTIFLDIDGVLNIAAGPNPTWKNSVYLIEKDLVEKFNTLLDSDGFQIVISSSWRDDMDDLKSQLEQQGFVHWDKVIGKTTQEFSDRGTQIADFICKNKIEKYVILDDVYFSHSEINDDYFIEIDGYTGITDDDISIIKEL